MGRYGLIGKNISYSFSEGYFRKKFKELGLDQHSYENFDLPQIQDFSELLKTQPQLKGLNVTIPYKEVIIPYIDRLDEEAARVGAVNTIRVTHEGLIGYNTDIYGFRTSLEPLLHAHHHSALVLGTGGASKAVAHVLRELGISFTYVSRNPGAGQLAYQQLDEKELSAHFLLVNTTPLGTWPHTEEKPSLPYTHITRKHLLYDLIYNPAKTAFLLEGERRGAQIKNGLEMLQQQAEKSWEIWNS